MRYLLPIAAFIALFIGISPSIRSEDKEQEDRPDTRLRTALPIYRGALYSADTDAKPQSESSDTMTPNEPATDEATLKSYLPLGEGESIRGKNYRFEMRWEPHTRTFGNSERRFFGRSEKQPTWEQKYRPLVMWNDKVIRLRFEFRPIAFTPLAKDKTPSMLSLLGQDDKKPVDYAPEPIFQPAIPIESARFNVLVNANPDGYSVHFSHDGVKWYRSDERRLFPCETLFVRIAVTDDASFTQFAIDADLQLDTPGCFIGTGEISLAELLLNTDENKAPVSFPLAFDDENGNLCLLIENHGEKTYTPGGWLGHISDTASGHICADGFHSGFPIQAKRTGVFTFGNPRNAPGTHTMTLHFPGACLQYRLTIPAKDGTVPSGFGIRMTNIWEQNDRGLEHVKHETFDDGSAKEIKSESMVENNPGPTVIP